MSTNQSTEARPANSSEAMRWEVTRQRKRILLGTWRNDLETHMANHLDASRFASWGPPTLALNLFKSVIQQLAVLYDTRPLIVNPDLDEVQTDYLNSMHLFSKSQVHNDLVVGLRESLIRLYWNPGNKITESGVQTALVTPDNVVVFGHPTAPTVPVRIEHAVVRFNPKAKEDGPYWDVWDISDPANPTFTILTAGEKRVDVTSWFIPEKELGNYPYIDPVTKAPFMPWVLYHAKDTGQMFTPNAWSELINGTLDMALLYSFYIHIVKDASWAQKYGIDVELNGQSSSGSGTATSNRVATDPSSILLFSSKDNNPGSLNTFTTATDAKSVIESIRIFADAVVSNIGIPPQDIQQVVSQSGVAIKLKREAIRKFQASFAPNFRLGDIELLQKAALISNLFSGKDIPELPTTGYNIKYTSLPLDHDEVLKEVTVAKMLMEIGLMSRIDLAMKLDPTLETRELAKEKILQVKLDNA